jgi:hypothetical protein
MAMANVSATLDGVNFGAGIDLQLPGYVEAAGDTIVVESLSGPKGNVSRTDMSVVHPSQLSSLGPCAA